MPNRSQMTEAELDHIAAGIRPSWELDDAPFRPGGLASPELEALLALNGASNGHASHTNGAAAALVEHQIVAQRVISVHPEPEDMLTRVDPVPPIHVLEEAPIAPVRVEAAPAAPVRAEAPQFTAEAAPQSQRSQPSNRPPPPSVRPPPVNVAPSQRPSSSGAAQADPFAAPQQKKASRAKSTSSSDFQAIKKSNKGLYIALAGGAVAAIVAIVAFSASGSSKSDGAKVESSPVPTQMPGSAVAHEIPPPPATDDLPAATAQTTAAATQAAAPVTTQVADLATSTTPPPTPPSTHASHADNPPPQHHASSPPSHSTAPAGGGGGKKGGIVRDVPF